MTISQTSSFTNSSILFILLSLLQPPPIYATNDQSMIVLSNQVFREVFKLKDGSQLTETNPISVNLMTNNVARLINTASISNILNATRALSDRDLLKILFLSVAGNFVVENKEQDILNRRCTLVVDPGTSALVVEDTSSTQYVILEVLVIVSIICLLRAWEGFKS